jgi:hypothetical protein
MIYQTSNVEVLFTVQLIDNRMKCGVIGVAFPDDRGYLYLPEGHTNGIRRNIPVFKW